uniref:Uncharacterized protein n=1 Tax=Chromera velia CCMP2878 TaxID=1169474 RepID=A0A0G4HCQ2_9ALVE|eukprot:Cvel_26224.t1-p1 / transcript=Cvel_26224.t1 / gene=Cvel_26224 / organism=Chromera_velia_CCMP2878 / gene_product=Putative ankyrin repeat protein RF_0381, putative / transcript_product=Putative ankyrin repeat protein RF_0381, putative / location=Cvel_scaffold3091:9384-10181(+) / protein_length=266 / sequence_SO=supercontig / SO=protein_coding / is_pseudo=false
MAYYIDNEITTAASSYRLEEVDSPLRSLIEETLIKIVENTDTPLDKIEIDSEGKVERETILHFAVWHGFINLAAIALRHGADIEEENSFDWTPLALAVASGWADFIEFLLNKGAEVGEDDLYVVLDDTGPSVNLSERRGESFISCMVWLTEVMLDHGADVNDLSDSERVSFLHLTVDWGSVDLVSVKRGADVRARIAPEWEHGELQETLRQWAIRRMTEIANVEEGKPLPNRDPRDPAELSEALRKTRDFFKAREDQPQQPGSEGW